MNTTEIHFGTKLCLMEIEPHQVASIQTLKGKALHITIDNNDIQTISSFISLYGDIVKKYIQENNVKNLSIQVKVTERPSLEDQRTIVILNKLA